MEEKSENKALQSKASTAKAAKKNTAAAKASTVKANKKNAAATKASTTKAVKKNTVATKTSTAKAEKKNTAATKASTTKANNKKRPATQKSTPATNRKKSLARTIIARLKEAYPDSDCTLDYNEAWKLLVSVRLAAQCTDARVNIIVQDLYKKFPDVAALAAAPVSEIEEIVRPCGLGHSKARDISACMKVLLEKYGGNVPDDFDALLALPGVGRKSANLIMGDVFGKPAIVTDTHCIRLVNRMGLVDGIKEPKKVEMELWKIIPPEEGNDFCHRLVDHGRAVCTARTNPYCDKCCLNDICAKKI